MSVERKKNEKKKVDKSFVIAICICVALALSVVGAIVLPEPIIGAVTLSDSRAFIEGSEEVKVVLNSPMKSGGILADAEYIMDETASADFSHRVLNLLKNAKYNGIDKSDTGIWKTKIVIYNTIDELRIYVDTDGIYLEKNGNLIEYRIPDSIRSDYDAMYAEINERLAS